jgi:hypothetical protein
MSAARAWVVAFGGDWDGEMADAPDDGTLLDAYIREDIATEWLRKASFETRSFAVITANLGLVTAFLALRTQLDLAQQLATGHQHTWATTALIAAGVSIVVAVLSALPWNYPSLDPDALRQLSVAVDQGKDTGIGNELREARVAQLQQTVKANNTKGVLSLLAFVALGVAAGGLVAALLATAT